MTRIVPEAWMPACRMERVITHWTAGGYEATDADRDHYHLLIEGDGRLVRGRHSIADNVQTGDGDYAAHTRRCNTGSIGVAVCCMAGARERPFHPGPHPLTPAQYEVLTRATADLCELYRIPVTERTVLAHGEVERLLGIPQRGKWDPMVLPWEPGLGGAEVGEGFRRRVRDLLTEGVGVDGQGAIARPVRVLLDGTLACDDGLLHAGAAWCPLRPLAERQGWTILRVDAATATLRLPAGIRRVPALIRGDCACVQLRGLAEALGWPPPDWDPDTRTVSLRSRPGGSGSS